jgi:hypothetical protein
MAGRAATNSFPKKYNEGARGKATVYGGAGRICRKEVIF